MSIDTIGTGQGLVNTTNMEYDDIENDTAAFEKMQKQNMDETGLTYKQGNE